MLEKKVIVEWFPPTSSLIEAYQQTEFRFSFIGPSDKNEVFKQCHQWVKCRDFLPDAVRATIVNRVFSIYGFSFDPKNNPMLDLDTMRMLVYKPDLKLADITGFEDKMFFGISLLNHYEKIMKISLSTLHRTKEDYNDKPVYLFIGNGEWMRSPFLISLYTFLIRLGDKQIAFKGNQELLNKYKVLIEKHSSGKIYDNDVGYLKSAWNILHLMLENRELLTYSCKTIDSIFENLSITNGSFHNRTGIKSLSDAVTPIQKRNEFVKQLKKEVL